MLAVKGALDDNRSWMASTVKGARYYVRAALKEILTGRPATTKSTIP